MSKLFILLIFLTIFLSSYIHAQPPTQPTYIRDTCLTTDGDAANSVYQANIKTVLLDLYNESSSFSFYQSTTGSSPDDVYGQYYCRGDVSSDLCTTCIFEAVQTLYKNCSHVRSGAIWFDTCSLRYESVSTYGTWQSKPSSYVWYLNSVSDPDAFAPVFGNTMNRLISQAAYGTNLNKIATGEGVVSTSETVYSLVQCSPELNGTQCEACLRSTYNFVPTCCGRWSLGVQVYYTSCQLMYSTLGRFYNSV